MEVPKPPFHSTTEELLYNIYLKLSSPVNTLSALDINTIAKLNAIINDADLATTENLINAISTFKGNVPSEGNTLEKLYNLIKALNYLSREDIDTLAEINSLLVDADLVKTEDLTNAINSVDNKREIQFFFQGSGDDDDCKNRDRIVIRGKINSLVDDCTNELSGVTYKSRVDTSASWIAHPNLPYLQNWINTTITGDHLTGMKFWLKCVPVYKVGKNGEAVNLFGYRVT